MSNKFFCFLLAGSFLLGNQLRADEESFKVFMGAVRLLADPDVLDELDISDEQVLEINKDIAGLRKRSIRIGFDLRSPSGNDDKTAIADEFVAEGEKLIKKTLVELQYKRLIQISRQQENVMQLPTSGLADKRVSEKLKLNPMVVAKIQRIEDDVESEIVALHEKFKSDMNKLLQARDEKVMDVLSEKQQSQFKTMFGKPFYKTLELYMFSRYWQNRAYTKKLESQLEEKGSLAPKSVQDRFDKFKKK